MVSNLVCKQRKPRVTWFYMYIKLKNSGIDQTSGMADSGFIQCGKDVLILNLHVMARLHGGSEYATPRYITLAEGLF